MTRRHLLLGVGVLGLGIGWYAFRPERLFIDRAVSETLPATADAGMEGSSPVRVLEGMFHGNAHATAGTATVYRLADGNSVLRLTDFETSNGPDVQVYLVAAADVNDNDTVDRVGFINLGGLKGNVGNQNYDIPADVDLTTYRSVTIWCRRFGVNFGTAPLENVSSAGST